MKQKAWAFVAVAIISLTLLGAVAGAVWLGATKPLQSETASAAPANSAAEAPELDNTALAAFKFVCPFH